MTRRLLTQRRGLSRCKFQRPESDAGEQRELAGDGFDLLDLSPYLDDFVTD
jgi:hypothetical protein